MGSIASLARRIARGLENAEDVMQESISDASRGSALTDSAMRPLRRKLPVTKQLFDFGGVADGGVASTRKAFAEYQAGGHPRGGDSEQ